MKQNLTIDLSTELAESFALPPAGIPLQVINTLILPPDNRTFHPRHSMVRVDDDLLPVISSAHVACGLHAGDPLVMHHTIEKLVHHGVQIGAHPSYPDVFDFGQRRIEVTHDELVSVLLYQFGALQGVLGQFGHKVRHVKCHGALSFDVAYEDWACAALIQAIQHFDPTMTYVAMAASPSVAQAKAAGLHVIEEGFADRGYDRCGRIVPRNHPNALLTDASAVVAQVVAMASGTGLITVDGSIIDLPAQSFCLHSDTPSAGKFARQLVAALQSKGFRIKALADLDR
jgi:UPF0271 protein